LAASQRYLGLSARQAFSGFGKPPKLASKRVILSARQAFFPELASRQRYLNVSSSMPLYGDDAAIPMVEGLMKRQGWRLPHWTAERAIYHAVFRLADSLPTEVLKGFRAERELLLQQPVLATDDRKRLDYLVSNRVEEYLDAGHGKCWLNRRELAEVVTESIKHSEGKTYSLHAWCVMPNHVHVVFEPSMGHQLPKILHTWKSFTAHEINALLGLKGPVWQAESYDHIVRNALSYQRVVEYVIQNPVKAHLRDWKWVFPKE